jgi:FlaA1/EpsC-like NDP-sugar epimerase
VKKLQHWQIVSTLLLFYDLIAVNLSYFVALWLRFDLSFSQIPPSYLSTWRGFVPVLSVLSILIFWVFRLYQSVWRFAGISELVRSFFACLISVALNVVLTSLFYRRMPISYYIIGGLFTVLSITGIRFSYRAVRMLQRINRPSAKIPTMIIGAGSTGKLLIGELQKEPHNLASVRCFIDDNPNKRGRYLGGVPVVGGREEILSAVQQFDIRQIYLAIPSATPKQRRDLLAICKETACDLKIVPSYTQILQNDSPISSLRPVNVQDLLGRDPIQVDLSEILSSLQGKTILVTGGGGSIGSELCRQIAAHCPKKLIIFDVYENNAYDIGQELQRRFPNLQLELLIGSVRDVRRLAEVFDTYRPDIVYHAAAHKHVPLMEDSPCEAIKNNVLGTYFTAWIAKLYDCKRFVLISTDKAVNPTNIMGASKRLCEMIIQGLNRICERERAGELIVLPDLSPHRTLSALHLTDPEISAKHAQTEYVAVRFGNVLGSNGSVIPLFRKQLEHHGPITVTHPDIIRYFMTIPEAVSLILQAGCYAKGGEIFVLDMGEPVKIDDLARNLIRLSGFRPGIDIEIKYIGLRPGEKLYEEKLMKEEELRKTPNQLIHIGRPLEFEEEEYFHQLLHLGKAAAANDPNIRALVEEILPTFHPATITGLDSLPQDRRLPRSS